MAASCSDDSVLSSLFLAAYSGKLAEVKALLKNNALSADVSDPIKGSTALQWACSGGSLEVVEWLVKDGGAQVTHRNKDDRTPLFFACEHCHKPVAEFLVGQRGVDVNAKDGPSGHSPLHRACIAGQTRETTGVNELISWLLKIAKADAEAKDLGGRKPGEADLTKEAPTLKPTVRAAEITKMLKEARSGVAPVTLTPSPRSAAPAPAPASPASARPATTLAAARAAASKTGSPKKGVGSPKKGVGSPKKGVGSPKKGVILDSPRRTSPSRVAERAAALTAKTKVVSSSTPPAVTSFEAPADSDVNAATAIDSPMSVVISTPLSPKELPAPVRAPKELSPSFAMRGHAVPVSSAADSPGHSPHSTDAAAPWSPKPRPGGVQPRTGGGLPVNASSARTGSPAAVTAAAAAAVTSATASTSPSPEKPSIVKQYAYGRKAASATPATAAAPPPEKASIVNQFAYNRKAPNLAATATVVTPSVVAGSRFQRTAPASSTPSTSATGTAAAVIGASNGPKASALAAAFENKARGRQGTTTVPAPRRASPGTTSVGLAARAPALSKNSNGGGPGGKLAAATVSSAGAHRSTPPTVPQASATATRVTPEEVLGKGSVMQRKQVYVAAAQKGNNGSSPSKNGAAPMLGKAKKAKEGSFMDKFVSMFSISPDASPTSSPRSCSRSPRSKHKSPKAPMTGNGSGKSPPASEPARLGFFNTNKSFKVPDTVEKE